MKNILVFAFIALFAMFLGMGCNPAPSASTGSGSPPPVVIEDSEDEESKEEDPEGGNETGDDSGNDDNGRDNGGDNESGNGNGAYLFPESMWGEWTGIKGYSIIPCYITGDKFSAIMPGNGSYSDYTKYTTLTRESKNVIRAHVATTGTEASGIWMLYPVRLASASFNGKVAEISQTSQSIQKSVFGGKIFSWLDKGHEYVVEAKNTDNGSKTTTETDEDGNFTVPDIIPGDVYEITPEGGTPVTVTPTADGEDIGTITITDGLNFKVSGEAKSSIMLADGTNYSCTLSIKNIGTVTASACTYQISGDDGESYSGIIGTIEPDKTKTIAVTLSCESIAEDKRFKKLNVVINDPINDKTWDDSASFLFYKSTFTVTVMTPSITSYDRCDIWGCVITPEEKSYRWGTDRSNSTFAYGQVTVPRLRGEYLIAFAGNNNETIYGIDVSTFSTHMTREEFQSKVESFTDTGIYEPNNNEESAKLITEPIIAYFHSGDLDYYLVKIE